MRALILGRSGQVAHSLLASAGEIDAQALGRPEIDLTDGDQLADLIISLGPDVVINAAAYTAVDMAESDRASAFALNRDGAGIAARAAYQAGAQFLHLSTDFVFNGEKSAPYCEDDAAAPLGIYGQSKYEGEIAVREAHPEAVIVRLSWVYSVVGSNFAKTMLRLAAAREEIGVVDDQQGRPTAAEDIAPALWIVARGLVQGAPSRRLYHLAASGRGSWADFAEQIMAASRSVGGPTARIKRIATSDYPTPARRPANSVLDCQRIAEDWGIRLPDWRESCDQVVRQLFRAEAPASA